MTNNFEHMCNGEYPFRFLANTTWLKINKFNDLALKNDASGWISKEQPFAPIAPRLIGGTND